MVAVEVFEPRGQGQVQDRGLTGAASVWADQLKGQPTA
jgi:hypothetical protein